ncbi:sensor histidine kinase [Streptomyces sp. NPDC056683]|uniref:sensor histidine kinase n=1 Tax=Streptomyces sp. NPDC056683 TaxID=3345910 RepID=UPI0036862D29
MRRRLAAALKSLRGRLIIGVTLLATAAVLASQLAGFFVLRTWLLDRVDQQLTSFQPPSPAFLAALRASDVKQKEQTALPSDFRVFVYDAKSHLMKTALGSKDKPGPRLPDSARNLDLREGRTATLPAVSGDGHWRVVLRNGDDGTRIVVALPLDTVDGAMSKLLWADVVLLAVTVAALLALSRSVVRLGLLPLTRMERTAADITESRPDLRLPDTDPHTEIGRLGRVLNSMLDRLQRALAEREASEARLRRFVADAGHELRTPLTSIQGYAQLALRPERRPAQEEREAQRLIVQNAERMALLVDDLQLLATLDKEPAYQSEPVDLLSLAADAVSGAAVHGGGHPADLGPLRGDGEDGGELDIVPAVGDPHRLRQIVENLLSNARTHTPPNTPVHVRVGVATAGFRAGGTNRPGRYSASAPLLPGARVAVLEVADEGPGLAASDAEHVFERFYRADPSRSRAHGGSGLGLAIAATIAEGHRGRLELDTAPGRGCTFRLVLPAAD